MNNDRYCVNFAHAIGDEVMVAGSGDKGFVVSRLDTGGPFGLGYKVISYATPSNARQENWYYERELLPIAKA